jgi:P27 family predicted phage terminase small subunit
MGRRGQPPKPAHLRLAEGTDRRGRSGRLLDRSKEPVAPDGDLEPPYEFSPDVLRVWERTVADLQTMGLASPADRYTLAAYCESVALFVRASALVRESSVVVPGPHGLVVDKAIIVQRHAANTMRLFAAEFGLTPAARMRVEVDRGRVVITTRSPDNASEIRCAVGAGQPEHPLARTLFVGCFSS